MKNKLSGFILLFTVLVVGLSYGSGAELYDMGSPIRSWPTGPMTLNRADPLGDALVAVCPLPGNQWYDMASGQYAVMSNSWVLDLGGATGGTLKLTFNGQQTTAISTSASTTLTSVKTPLSALTNLVGVVGLSGATGGPWTIGINGTTGPNGTLTLQDSSTGGTGATLTLTSQTPPTSVTPDGTWPWPGAVAMDTFPGGVTTVTMKLPTPSKLFYTDPNTTGLPGYAEMWITQPDTIPSQLLYEGDTDNSDWTNLYWNTAGKFTTTILNAAGTGQQTAFPTTGFVAAPHMCLVVKSVSNASADVWANFNATSGAQTSYMVSQNHVTTADVHKTWNSGGNWIFINGQGPQGSDASGRFHGKQGAFVFWPHPITYDQANQLLRDPWCFLTPHRVNNI